MIEFKDRWASVKSTPQLGPSSAPQLQLITPSVVVPVPSCLRFQLRVPSTETLVRFVAVSCFTCQFTRAVPLPPPAFTRTPGSSCSAVHHGPSLWGFPAPSPVCQPFPVLASSPVCQPVPVPSLVRYLGPICHPSSTRPHLPPIPRPRLPSAPAHGPRLPSAPAHGPRLPSAPAHGPRLPSAPAHGPRLPSSLGCGPRLPSSLGCGPRRLPTRQLRHGHGHHLSSSERSRASSNTLCRHILILGLTQGLGRLHARSLCPRLL